MSQMQKGHCAFTAACLNTHAEHIRLEGTNRIFCSAHFQVVQVAPAASRGEVSFASVRLAPRRRRSSWLESALGR